MDIKDVFLAARMLRPYYAHALASITPIESSCIETMGVDESWRLYYSKNFLESKTIDELAIIIADHELQHLLRNHSERSKNYTDKFLWNMAADLEINDDIQEKVCPKDCLLPKHFKLKDGDLAESYFDKLLNSNNIKCFCSGGSGAGNQKNFELPKDKNSISKEIANQIRKITAVKIKEYSKSMGDISNGVLMWADSILQESKIPWEKLISINLKYKIGKIINGKQDFSYRKISKRSNSIIFPSLIKTYPKIGILIDTSGSMESFGGQVLGHVKKISESISEDILFFTGDCEVKEISKNKRNIKFIGGGGSNLIPLYESAIKKQVEICIAITDGETIYPKKLSKPLIVIKLIEENEIEIFKL